MVDKMSVSDHVPFGIMVINQAGVVKYSNDIALDMIGGSKKQVDHAKILELIPESNVIKAIKTGYPSIISVHKEKKPPIILYECSMKDENNHSTGLIIMFHASFVEHLAYHCKKIGELKQELDLIMDLVGELVTITDGQGRILRVNEACERIMGVKRKDFIGKPMDMLESEKIVDHSSTKKVIEEGRSITIVQTTKSGKRLLVTGYPVFNEKGTLEKIINISKDITETEELSKKLEETKELARQYQSELSNKAVLEEHEPIVKSRSMKNTYDLINRIAEVDSPVLFIGESGVGKEFFAKILHEKSIRKEKPFVKVNFGAIPEHIMEKELFGDLRYGTKGLIAAAANGTLFLDEIEKIPLHLQVKLLQMLQENEVHSTGDLETIHVDVRVITSTNQNLEDLVKEGRFRTDLYYWLNVATIYIPSLKERKEEVPFLAQYFLNVFNKKYNRRKTFNQHLLQAFVEHEWAGNVRELQNMVERLVVTTSHDEITDDQLPGNFFKRPIQLNRENLSLKEAVDLYEKQMIEDILSRCRNMKEASGKLGVDPSTLSRKIKKLNIEIAKMQYRF
ncbi:sigma 54-interacting transcriptional regulator [Domibacillus sp. A3M-37]|uniref:sigma 54-interacting transcriptional regulator n=1 Tax=Domibacillus sp. A3M-37 TaxID=2962037 RepID=UPI0020B72365|nr:sigma 54-interacting transcriptional regulator [Domibacillus sp. A3M-37]MCP3761352.1 sigma 54-interacting transcriptional regulator [Domibacillus sp. A3M-37]